jgi:hypothetical protein
VNDEVERMWMEAVVAKFKVKIRHCLEGRGKPRKP